MSVAMAVILGNALYAGVTAAAAVAVLAVMAWLVRGGRAR